MKFPTNASGRPYVRIDARTGSFAVSAADGGPETVDMIGQILDLDLNGAEQGWLRFDQNGLDWLPLAGRDEWSQTPKPSPDHVPGVCIDVMCAIWPEPKVRQLRHSSKAVTSFIAGVAAAAGEVPNGKAVRVKITGVKPIKIGKGTSVEIIFKVAPRAMWPDVSDFDSHRGSDAEAADPGRGNGEDDSGFADMSDIPFDGPAQDPLDEWT